MLQPLVHLEKPVVAAVNGWAVGAGIGVTLACDFRLCGESANFYFGFRRLTLVPDLGVAWFLPRLVGYRAARDVLFSIVSSTLRQHWSSAWSMRSLLTEHSYHAQALARELSDGPTLALGLMKGMLQSSCEADLGSFLERETLVQTLLVGSRDHREGVDALACANRPQFRGC